MFAIDPADERDLRWYFEQGPNPKLTPKQRRRWEAVDRALNGYGCWLRVYLTSIDSDDPLVAVAVALWDEGMLQLPDDCKRGVTSETVICEVTDGGIQRLPVSRDIILAADAVASRGADNAVERAILVSAKAVASLHLQVEYDGYTRRKGLYARERGRGRSLDPPPYVVLHKRWRWSVPPQIVEWYAWGGLRVGVEEARLLADNWGADSLKTAVAMLEWLVEETKRRTPKPDPQATQAPEPKPPKPKRKEVKGLNEWLRENGVRDEIWDPGVAEEKVGKRTTTVTELATKLRHLEHSSIRRLLKEHGCPGADTPNTQLPLDWFKSQAGQRFWKDATAEAKRRAFRLGLK